MREALLLTEGNLSSFIGTRDNLGAGDHTVITRALKQWRHEVRKALGSFPAEQVAS